MFKEKVGTVNPSQLANNASPSFVALSKSQWDSLREIGTLKVRQIRFSPSSSELSLDSKRMLDAAATDIAHYPNYRVLIKGHTGLSGDSDANQTLSQDRADAVKRYLEITHGITDARLLSTGVGALEPLPRMQGEGNRAYRYRLPRVELILKAGSI